MSRLSGFFNSAKETVITLLEIVAEGLIRPLIN
jgi:hypothetical protein